jgi:LmbE family N-acetylglucosaminyl deacetylase
MNVESIDGRDADNPSPPRLLWPYQSALVVVAHPDDETLWAGGTMLMHPEAGGTMLMHPETRWTVAALCRRSDPDRAPRFHNALAQLGATGTLGDLDDGPEQTPLATAKVEAAVLALTGRADCDLILTHSSAGEYTRHRRHEETGEAVLALWDAGTIHSRELWAFAYRDAQAIKEADVFNELSKEIRERKRALVTGVYGFAPDSFEAQAALRCANDQLMTSKFPKKGVTHHNRVFEWKPIGGVTYEYEKKREQVPQQENEPLSC